MNVLDFTLMQMEFYVLMIVRISGLFIFAPFFGSADIPVTVKGLLSVVFALVIFPAVWDPTVVMPHDLAEFTSAIFRELCVGILLGFAANMIFLGIQFGGFLAGHAMGLAMANIVDPLTEAQVSIVGQIYFFMLMMIFIIIGGPDWLLMGMAKSYQLIPPGGMIFTDLMAGYLVELSAQLFVTAFVISAPIAGTIFIANVMLGFINKTMPQMNVFVVGLPMHVMVGVFIASVGLPVVAEGYDVIFNNINEVIDDMLMHMSPMPAGGTV